MNNIEQTLQELKKKKRTSLKGYNYSEPGYYFVTLCSKDKINIFGKINNNYVGDGLAPSRDNVPVRYKNNMALSILGQIIDKQWNDIQNQYDAIDLDEYVIMPNHIHGILIINNRTGASPVPTISNIIGSFKSKTSIEYLGWIKKNALNISGQIWQRSFYDHVIRNNKLLTQVYHIDISNSVIVYIFIYYGDYGF